jgi:hypothetical protein
LFVVAAVVTAFAIPPALALGGRRGSRARMLDRASVGSDASDATDETAAGGSGADGLDSPEPGLAL